MDNSSKSFRVFAHVILMFVCLVVLIPFCLLITSSLMDESVLISGGYKILSKNISFEAYRYLFAGSGNLFGAYKITIFVTAIGTFAGLFMITMLAYALSIKGLPGRKIISFLVFFTMLFNGGLIPTYMMYANNFHIKNTLPALIVPGLLVNAFYIIITRSFFTTGIPEEIIEAAHIDGAGEFRVFFRIVLPISMPILATVGLMLALGYWNNWTNGLYYVTERNLYSVQQTLTDIMRNMQALSSGQFSGSAGDNLSKDLPQSSLKMAIAVVGALPILCVYPFFQRYFVKGITLGAVKG